MGSTRYGDGGWWGTRAGSTVECWKAEGCSRVQLGWQEDGMDSSTGSQRHARVRYTDVAFTDGSLQPATREEPARVAFGIYATGTGLRGADVHGGALPSGATVQDAETTAVYAYLARTVRRARGRDAKVRALAPPAIAMAPWIYPKRNSGRLLPCRRLQ